MLHIYVSLQNALARLRDAEDGATAVEYGLIVSLIAAVIIVIVGTLGESIRDAFTDVVNNM